MSSVIVAVGVVALLIGVVLGYLLATHIHSLASKGQSALQRATTLPGADVATLNAKLDGLGDKVQAAISNAAKPVASAIAAAPAAADAVAAKV